MLTKLCNSKLDAVTISATKLWVSGYLAFRWIRLIEFSKQLIYNELREMAEGIITPNRYCGAVIW